MNILATGVRSVAATTESWQAILKVAYRRPSDLADELKLPDAMVADAEAVQAGFRLFAPQPFVDAIERGRVDDPLLLQIWPTPAELKVHAGESSDPVGDTQANSMPGLLQKYSGRALLVLTGACAIHCRYCFRRNWSYDQSPKSLADWEPALAAIASDPTIHEVILSGGDPLIWDDEKLGDLVRRIALIDHVRRLRVHTRMPVVIPQRVTPLLLEAVCDTRMQTLVVIHANHRRELSEAACQAMQRLSERGVILLNQSVLLARINDDVDTLVGLSERLIECGVLPYYLHQLDRVTGSQHFEVPVERGRSLIEEMRRRLPGYLVPRYVTERPGAPAKIILA